MGRGDPRKNLADIPEALQKARLEIPLVAIGWSGEKPWENVIPLGYINNDELASVYSGSIALIFPSSCESYGLQLFSGY